MDEGRALAEIEAALRRDDPGLAAQLASFTVGPSRRLRAVLVAGLFAVVLLVVTLGSGGDGESTCQLLPTSANAAAQPGPTDQRDDAGGDRAAGDIGAGDAPQSGTSALNGTACRGGSW